MLTFVRDMLPRDAAAFSDGLLLLAHTLNTTGTDSLKKVPLFLY